MSGVPAQKQRRDPPSSPVGLAGNSFTSGLRNLWYFHPRWDWRHCLVTGAAADLSSAGSAILGTHFGLFIPGSTSGNRVALPLAMSVQTPITILVACNFVSGVVPWMFGPQWDGIYESGHTGYQINSTSGSDFSGVLNPTSGPFFDRYTTTSEDRFDWVAVTMSGANDLRASRNGGVVAQDTSCTAVSNASTTFRLASDGNSANAADAGFRMVGVWSRAFHSRELVELSGNPWQLFTPRPRRIYIPAAAGGTAEGAGSSSGAATGTAVGSATAQTAGSSAGTGAATGVGAVTASAVMSAAGAATGSGAGAATSSGVASSAGVATGAAEGASFSGSEGAAQSAGVATATASGASLVSGDGQSAGVAVPQGAGAATGRADVLSQGLGAALAVGAPTASGDGSSIGAATGAAVGASLAAGESTGYAAGSSTAIAVGAALGQAVLQSEGMATARAIGFQQGSAGNQVTLWGEIARVRRQTRRYDFEQEEVELLAVVRKIAPMLHELHG